MIEKTIEDMTHEELIDWCAEHLLTEALDGRLQSGETFASRFRSGVIYVITASILWGNAEQRQKQK